MVGNFTGTVLLVEQNAEAADSKLHTFRRAGHSIHLATTLAEAELFLKRSHPDAIVLSDTLPDGCGYEFCQKIRDVVYSYIILLGINARGGNESRGHSVGCDKFLEKSCEVEIVGHARQMLNTLFTARPNSKIFITRPITISCI